MQISTKATRPARVLVWLMLGSLLIGMTGCGGCRSETPQERQARLAKEAEQKAKEEEEKKKKEEKEKEKRKFIVEAPVAKPSDTEIKLSRAKKGHWMTVTQLMKSNFDDWGGETTLQVVDSKSNPVPIALTPYTLSTTRPVQLAKGRPRFVENLFFAPQSAGNASVKCTLRERNYGAVVGDIPIGTPLTMMKSYQYFFVVLAKEPNRYTFLKSLNGVLVPQDTLDGSEDLPHYQVLLPDISKQVPLPDNPMCWTTIAFVLWDEVDPDQLDRQRREALIDWLHWGGQLIVNGPDSLQLLENSFLAPYLPATDGGAAEITKVDVQTLAKYWSQKLRRQNAEPPKPLKITRNWSGVNLNLADGVGESGLAVSTGGLLVERRVGRGRIVVSRMQLAERDLLTWSPHFDDLFNAGIMRRPPRVWAAGKGTGLGGLHGEWANHPGHMRDAQYVTHLRLFSRDVHADPNATNWRNVPNPQTQQQSNFYGVTDFSIPESKPPIVAGGIGAWNNFNATSQAAREALREAAGVQVPHRSFVVTCLAVYLVVLVPLNWFFFKALGRVEYAWIAAPIIALVGTGVVVKQAQLDIGFVRAQTEIALVEIQGDYPRAHVSRYTALYTSLSTVYDMEFDDPSAVAAPFPRGLDPQGSDFKMLTGQRRSAVELTQAKNVKLAGVQVSSATTEMLHSEQMHPLDGPLTYSQLSTNQGRVVNQSQFPLKSVAVVRRVDDGDEPRLIGGWIGELEAGSGATVTFAPLLDDRFADERAKQGLAEAKRLDLEPMFALALDPRHMTPGDTRLVGRIDKVLPGVTVTPSAAQVRGAALVVAHLQRAPLASPTPDVNSPRDVIASYDDLGGEDFGDDFGG